MSASEHSGKRAELSAERCAAVCRWLHDEPLQLLELVGDGVADPRQVQPAARRVATTLRLLLEQGLQESGDDAELLGGLCDIAREATAAGAPVDLRVARMDRTVAGEEATSLLEAVREAVASTRRGAPDVPLRLHCNVASDRAQVWICDELSAPRRVRPGNNFGVPGCVVGSLDARGRVRVISGRGPGTVVELGLRQTQQGEDAHAQPAALER